MQLPIGNRHPIGAYLLGYVNPKQLTQPNRNRYQRVVPHWCIMATKASITNARKLAHSITTNAKASNAKVAAKALTAPNKAPQGVAKGTGTAFGAAMANTFYAQRVVRNPKVPAPNAGSFYGRLQTLAAKPITLAALVGKALAANKFTSTKNHGMVARVRTRNALTRFNYLMVAK